MAKYRELFADLEDGAELDCFFGHLRMHNNGVDIDQELKDKIEKHMEYIWSKDRNAAVRSDQEREYMAELPDETRNKIYTIYFFQGFIERFKYTFNVPHDWNEYQK